MNVDDTLVPPEPSKPSFAPSALKWLGVGTGLCVLLWVVLAASAIGTYVGARRTCALTASDPCALLITMASIGGVAVIGACCFVCVAGICFMGSAMDRNIV